MPAIRAQPGLNRPKLAAAGLELLEHLRHVWSLSVQEQLALLGRPASRSTLMQWRQRPPQSVSDDLLTRLSYLAGIYEGLQRFWRNQPDQADRWIRQPNSDPVFRQRTPLEYMLTGGIPAMERVRGYIDFANGGPPSRDESLSWGHH